MPLIDCHVHLNNYHESDVRPTAENVGHLLAEMDANGIDHAVVLTSYKIDLQRPSAEELLRVVGAKQPA